MATARAVGDSLCDLVDRNSKASHEMRSVTVRATAPVERRLLCTWANAHDSKRPNGMDNSRLGSRERILVVRRRHLIQDKSIDHLQKRENQFHFVI